MLRHLFLPAAVALLTGCATTSPPIILAKDHPANPEAPEGVRVLRQTSLLPDETTRRSSALLSAAQKEQEHWDAYGPVSGTGDEEPATQGTTEMKGMHHEP